MNFTKISPTESRGTSKLTNFRWYIYSPVELLIMLARKNP